MIRRRAAATLAALSLLTSCVAPRLPRTEVPPPVTQPPPPANALAAGVAPGPALADLPLSPEGAARALAAFRLSCRALVRRADTSGLTRPEDWRPACEAAASWSDADAPAFFSRYFETVRVGAGTAFATGYYEPEIAASLTPGPGYAVPIYSRPPDLVAADVPVCPPTQSIGEAPTDVPPCPVRKRWGRYVDGQLVPYFDRAAIEDGALAGQGLELAWAADPVAFFFLQIQGSGRLRLPDGSEMRIGYAGQNGHDYTAIGALMKQRGLLESGRTTMQDIVAWLRAHPDEGRALMREDRSYIFFKVLTDGGPFGALGAPVTPRTTVAADPRFVPLGAPVWLGLDNGQARGLWVAQDTGGAIKGANRFDTYWGPGEEAARIAGGMAARGQALLLLPAGTLARLAGDHAGSPAQR